MPTRIPRKHLEDLGACEEQVDLFDDLHIDGDRENIPLVGALDAADWFAGLFDQEVEHLARKLLRAARRGDCPVMASWVVP